MSEGYQQAQYQLQLAEQRAREEQERIQRQLNEQRTAREAAERAAATPLKPASGTESQQFAEGRGQTQAKNMALDARINLINTTRQVNQTYNQLSTQLDTAINQQQEIVDKGMHILQTQYRYSDPNYIPAWLKPAVDNLTLLKNQRNNLDTWHQKSTNELETYEAKINLISGGAGQVEYVSHKGDTFTVTYKKDGVEITESFPSKYDADQFISKLNAVTSTPDLGGKYVITPMKQNPAQLLSNLIGRGTSALDAWIASGNTPSEQINNFVWGNLAKGAYSFVELFDPRNYEAIMRGVADLPQSLPAALKDWAAGEPTIITVLKDDTPPLYERAQALFEPPDVERWVNQKPNYELLLQIVGAVATGEAIGGLFGAIDAAPSLTAAERLELLRRPPLLTPKLEWGDYRSLVGGSTIDDLTNIAKSRYGYASGLIPSPTGMPQLIRSQLKWGRYPSLARMKTIEDVGVKLMDYAYVDSERYYPGYTLMKVKDPDGMYRLYLQTGSDLIEIPQDHLITTTRIGSIPQSARFSLEDYNSLLDDIRPSASEISGFKPYSLEDWNRVVSQVIDGKKGLITVVPPVTLLGTSNISASETRVETVAGVDSRLDISPAVETAIINALLNVQLAEVPQITAEVVEIISDTKLEQIPMIDDVADYMVDQPDLVTPQPVIDVVPEPKPPIPKPTPPSPPDLEPPPKKGKLRLIEDNDDEIMDEAKEKRGRVRVRRFRVVYGGATRVVKAGSHHEALAKVKAEVGGRYGYADVLRLP